MPEFDVVIIGAGAAGIGAGLELAGTGLRFVMLEAADRVGGRALTDTTTLPVPWDHGCHWLHSGDVNPLVPWADRLGAAYFKEERQDHFAIWQGGRFASPAELEQAGAATQAAFAAIEAAPSAGRDVSIQQVLPDAGRWTAGVRCILQYMAGADPDQVSAPGYRDYEDTGADWPVVSGYGALIAGMAAGLPIRTGLPVDQIVEHPGTVEIHTPAGQITAGAAIVTVSTNVLTSGAIRFTGGETAAFLETVADLPCGTYEKVAVAVPDLPPEVAGKIFCMVDPGSGQTAVDFQVMPGPPPVFIAHLGGDAAGAAVADGPAAMTALAVERLCLAFGSAFGKRIIATGTSTWRRNPLIGGSYATPRPGAAHQRRRAIAAETGRVGFAGEALSARWPGTAHGAYQSGRDKAREIAGLFPA